MAGPTRPQPKHDFHPFLGRIIGGKDYTTEKYFMAVVTCTKRRYTIFILLY